MAALTNVDSRGIVRRGCTSCACDCYNGGAEKKKCIDCGYPPGKHRAANLSTLSSSVSSQSSGVSSISALSPPPSSICDGGYSYNDSSVFISSACQFPGCQKESDFDPNTGVQKAYCQEHFVYTQTVLQQTPAFTTPRPQWSLGNADSSDVASSQSDSSDSEQDSSSNRRVQSDSGRSKSAAALNSSSAKGGLLANVFSSFFLSGSQNAPSIKANPQPISPRKRTQSAGRVPALSRPMTAPSQQVQQPITTPQLQAQQSIPVPQTIPGEINVH